MTEKYLTPDEYEKLYEDGLWRHQQALEAIHSSSTAVTDTEKTTQLILARANLDGILRQQAQAVGASPEVQESAKALLRSFRFQHDIKIPTTRPQKGKENPKSIAHMFTGTTDDFFDLYPECMKEQPDFNHGEGEESSSSDQEEDGTGVAPKSAKQPPTANQPSPVINVDTPMESSSSMAQKFSTTSQPQPPLPAAPVNPYARQPPRPARNETTVPPSHHPSNSYCQQQQQQQQQQQHHQRTHETPDYSAAWEDHHRQNPFQTAREFSAVEQKARNQHPQRPPPPPQRQFQHDNHGGPMEGVVTNPYDPPAQQPPVIPESLRRKYRPPTKGAYSSAPAKAGQQVQQKKPTGSSTNKSTEESNHKKDDEEEDELPEELKRFGKELVQKIENEIMDGGDPITFDDIAGLHDAKQTIQEVICWPMKRPDLFTGLRKAPNGLLLYGPPGTGKTLIGKAIAHESGATFFSISSSSLTSKWIGEGEKLVRTMFAVAAVREPSVVFIDEIDSLLTQRKSDENEASRRIKTEFLVQLDGTGTTAQGRVLTIGATNRPQELDEAARRRFVKRLYIPLPVEADRGTLLRVLLDKNKHRLSSEEVDKLARETEGFSGADLKALCTDAAMGPIRKLGAKALQVEASDVPPISYKHFRQSLRSMKPSVAPGDLVQYEEWDKVYGSKRIEDEMDDDSSDDEWKSVFASDTV